MRNQLLLDFVFGGAGGTDLSLVTCWLGTTVEDAE